VESLPGVTLIETAEPRSVAKLAGVVETVRVRPRDGVQSFEAVLSDGTGSATAVWLGRRSIPGLTIGSKILVEGRVGGTPGKLLVMNPTYELAPQEL
jgi:RecG-like helicase